MADDDKIKLGIAIDQESIKREAGQAGTAIGKELADAVNKAVSSALSGQLMGTGGAPNLQQMPGGVPRNKDDSLLAVVATLRQIHMTLIAGLSGGGGMGGGGGGGGTGVGAFGAGAFQQPQQPKKPGMFEGVGGMISNAVGIADRIASAVFTPSYWHMMATGGAGLSEKKWEADMLGNIPILNSMIAAPMKQGLEGAERIGGTGFDLYRRYGGDAVKTYKEQVGLTSSYAQDEKDLPQYFNTIMGQYHLDDQELAGVIRQAAGYGSAQSIRGLAGLQGFYGMGQEGAGYMGALMRGGGFQSGQAGTGKEQIHDFAEVLAIGVSTGLDRSRWPEVFESLTMAVKAQPGDVSKAGMVSMMDFIGSMGERYKGMGAGTQSAIQMMTGMMTGQMGALSNVYALQAAGMGGDKSYAESIMDVETGALNTPEGQQRTMQKWMNLPAVRKYIATGDRADLGAAYLNIRKLMPNAKPADVKAMLEAMRRRGLPSGPSGDVTQYFERDLAEGKPPPGIDASLRVERVKASTVGIGVLRAQPSEKELGTVWSRGRNVSDVSPEYQGGGGAGGGGGGAAGGDGGAALSRAGFAVTSDTDASRSTKGEGGAYKGGARPHDAQDLTGPPGSPIYTPVSGTMDDSGWFTVPGANMGFGIGFQGDNGVFYRFLHLDKIRKEIVAGKRYAAGTLIGHTARHNLGQSKSHLHLEAWKSKQAWTAHMHAVAAGTKDPEAPLKAIDTLGAAGVATMFGGAGAAPTTGAEGSTGVAAGGTPGGAGTVKIVIEDRTANGIKAKAKDAGKGSRQLTNAKR